MKNGSILSASILLLAFSTSSCISPRHHQEEEEEEVVTFDQLPANIREALLKASEGGTITTVEMETKNGKKVYEADVKIHGEKYEIKVSENGELISKEEDED